MSLAEANMLAYILLTTIVCVQVVVLATFQVVKSRWLETTETLRLWFRYQSIGLIITSLCLLVASIGLRFTQ